MFLHTPETVIKASPGLRRERTVAGVMARPVSGHKAPTRSTPGSPVRESHPLHWFVRDIDIGDPGPPSDTRSDTGPMMSRSVSSVTRRPHYMMPLQRTRSRHDCNFIPGTPFLNTGKVFMSVPPLNIFCGTRPHR